jgi:hypothetical protein
MSSGMWRCVDPALADLLVDLQPDPTPLVAVDFHLSLFLYSWLFPTDGSICSHLLTLVPRSRIFFTLKLEAIRFSKMSVKAGTTQRHIPEDDILHSRRCGNLKSYTVIT